MVAVKLILQMVIFCFPGGEEDGFRGTDQLRTAQRVVGHMLEVEVVAC